MANEEPAHVRDHTEDKGAHAVEEPSAAEFRHARTLPVDEDWYKRAVFYEVLVRGVRRLQPRRLRRPARADRQARLPAVARRRLPVAAAVLRLAAARRRLRHPRLLQGAAASSAPSSDFVELLDEAHARGIRVITDLVMNHTSDQHPWFQASRSDPDGPYGDFYVWSDDDTRYVRRPDHLRRHRDVQLDLRPRARAVLLAPVLLPPARPQLRQPRRPGGDARRAAVLAGPRASTASGSTPCPTSSSARAPTARTSPRRTSSSSGCARWSTRSTRTACCWPRPTSGRRTSSSTSATPDGGDECHMAFHFPLMPRIFMAVRRESALPDLGDPGADAGDPAELPVGHLPAQPRRADARDGHRRRARLHVRGVRQGPADEGQHRHPPAPRPAAGQRPRPARAVHRAAAVAARLARSSTTATRSAWATTSGSATATASARPMQWTPDRNAGFSTCDPGRLYLPVIMDPVYGYQAVNVEAQMRNSSTRCCTGPAG